MAAPPRRTPGNQKLGRRMRELRDIAGMNQDEVAQAMEIRPDTLRGFENGTVLPQEGDIENFCIHVRLSQQQLAELLELRHTGIISALISEASLPASSIRLAPLMIGPQKTSVVIIDGNGATAVPIENITLQIAEEEAELPPRLLGIYDEYCRRVVAREKAGASQIPYNGPIYSINTITITRTPGNEIPRWILSLKRNRYFRYAALVTNPYTEYEHEGRRTTIVREYHPETFDPRRPPSFLSLFGISTAVYLRPENQLVFVKKGPTEIYPEALGAAMAEGLSPVKDPMPHGDSWEALVHCITRGAMEELGETFASAINPTEIVLLSLAFNWDASEYTLINLVSVNMLLKDLKRSALTASDVKLEIENIYAIPAQPIEHAFRELFQQTSEANSIWTPLGLSTMVMALRFLNLNTYNRCDTELQNNPQCLGVPMPIHLLTPHFTPQRRSGGYIS